MFSLYKGSLSKKENITSLSEDKKAEVKKVLKALKLKIVTTYVGDEDELTILKTEQAADSNRKKTIENLEAQLKKLSPTAKAKVLDLKNRILQKEKAIESIKNEIKNLNEQKNKAINSYEETNFSVNRTEAHQLISSENEKQDAFQIKNIDNEDFKDRQEYLKKIYAAKEKLSFKSSFRDLKIIDGQEAVAEEIKEKLKAIMLADDSDYYIVIQQLQKLVTEVDVSKNNDLNILNDNEFVKISKKIFQQKAIFQKYKDYLNEKGHISPAQERTKLVMEVNKPRQEFNSKVVECVAKKYYQEMQKQHLIEVAAPFKEDISLKHIKIGAKYCIAKLEEIDTPVQETLRKKCIEAGWSLNTKNELVYKKDQKAVLSISDLDKISYGAYIEIGKQRLTGKHEINLNDFQAVSSSPAGSNPQKRMLPVFEENIKRKKQKVAANKSKSNFWLFCLDKTLVSIKPDLVTLVDLKASLNKKIKTTLQVGF